MNNLRVSAIVNERGLSIPPEFHSASGTFLTSGLSVNLSGDPPPPNRLLFKVLTASGSPDPTVALCYSDFTAGSSGVPCEVVFKWDGADYSDASQITSSGYNYSIGPAAPSSGFAWKRLCCPAIAGSSFWDTPVNIWILPNFSRWGDTLVVAPPDIQTFGGVYEGFRLERAAGVRTFTGTYFGIDELPYNSQSPDTSGTIREVFSVLRAQIASSSILSQAAKYTVFFLRSDPPALVV